MTKTYGVLKYPLKIVLKAFDDKKIRQQWDIGAVEEVLGTQSMDDLYIEQFRVYLKLTGIDDREIIQEKKKWSNYTGDPKKVLYSFKSIEHPKYPINKKIVRAETVIGGYYFEEDTLGKETKVIIVNHCNMKFTWIIAKIANKKTVETAEEFFGKFIKGCEIALKETN